MHIGFKGLLCSLTTLVYFTAWFSPHDKIFMTRFKGIQFNNENVPEGDRGIQKFRAFDNDFLQDERQFILVLV